MGCRRPAADTEDAGQAQLLIAAAQSLQGCVEISAERFHDRHPQVAILWTYGASGVLAQQIINGAPVDVLLSASDREMDRLEAGDLLAPGTRRVLACNRLVLIAAGGIPSSALGHWEDLQKPVVRRLALGDPTTVSAGEYADQVLVRLGLRERLAAKTVYGANVRQVLDYVARGEAEAGVVFASDVGRSRQPVRVVADAPSGSHRPIRYPMAVIRRSAHPSLAREFLEVLSSPGMQAILERAGFLPAQGDRTGPESRATAS